MVMRCDPLTIPLITQLRYTDQSRGCDQFLGHQLGGAGFVRRLREAVVQFVGDGACRPSRETESEGLETPAH
jgi:hypothetical protein